MKTIKCKTEFFISLIGLSMCAFHVWIAWIGTSDAMIVRALHLGFALVMGFLIAPVNIHSKPNLSRILILIPILISTVVMGYIVVEYDYLINRMTYVDSLRTFDWIFGILAILTILEATRRLIGITLPLTAGCFFLYSIFFADIRPELLIEQMYLGTQGIFGIPIYVSATYVFLFILFGSLIEKTGTGKLFMDFALSIAGRSAGGPAKVSCLTSGMFGTVSGSAVANVMTTGSFTIPMMKKLGYRSSFSGGIEAVASTGGQIMPPIMGAAAFIMAEFLGKSYLDIAILAILPAILYYVALFFMVHFEAKNNGMTGLPGQELPKLMKVLSTQGHLSLPILVVVGVLLVGYSPPLAALCGIVSTIPAACLRANTRERLNLKNIKEALVQGAKNATSVALACACAGTIIGIIFLTGLGLEFTNLIVSVADRYLLLALLLTMIAGIILGMGMPTAAAYIMQTALLVPAMVKHGEKQEAAHMFVFYFAILSAITPPVALAVYAANGISQARIWDSSLEALKLGAAGYLIPFMFVFSPEILSIGTADQIAITFFVSVCGIISLAAGLSGFFITKASKLDRLILILTSIFCLLPGGITKIIGLLMLSTIMTKHFLKKP